MWIMYPNIARVKQGILFNFQHDTVITLYGNIENDCSKNKLIMIIA
jgi:hypothetical protein